MRFIVSVMQNFLDSETEACFRFPQNPLFSCELDPESFDHHPSYCENLLDSSFDRKISCETQAEERNSRMQGKPLVEAFFTGPVTMRSFAGTSQELPKAESGFLEPIEGREMPACGPLLLRSFTCLPIELEKDDELFMAESLSVSHSQPCQPEHPKPKHSLSQKPAKKFAVQKIRSTPEMIKKELRKQAKKLKEHWAVARVVAPSPFKKLTASMASEEVSSPDSLDTFSVSERFGSLGLST